MNDKKFKTSETFKNLARAFAGECQAGARYQFLSQKCIDEEYNFLSNTLKTLAKNEMAHAKTYFNQIVNNSNEIVKNIDIQSGYPFKSGEMIETFKFAMEDELMEATTIYPKFAEIAHSEGFEDIAYIFERVALVEKEHYNVLKQIYDGLKSKKLYKSALPITWKCSNCGNEHTQKEAWKICDLCSMPQGYVEVPIKANQELKSKK